MTEYLAVTENGTCYKITERKNGWIIMPWASKIGTNVEIVTKGVSKEAQDIKNIKEFIGAIVWYKQGAKTFKTGRIEKVYMEI
ncbi:MAG: hypothetical protein Q8R18_03505 [bacterium]|nr:hypothetical protein [bacterium]